MTTSAYRHRVLTALMIAQVMGGISAGVAFSLGSLLAADIGGTEWGGAASTVTTVGAALFFCRPSQDCGRSWASIVLDLWDDPRRAWRNRGYVRRRMATIMAASG